VDKELKDRIAHNNKEELKSNYEYLRILIFFLAAAGSGVVSMVLKENPSSKEIVGLILGVMFILALFVGILRVFKFIKFHLKELKKMGVMIETIQITSLIIFGVGMISIVVAMIYYSSPATSVIKK